MIFEAKEGSLSRIESFRDTPFWQASDFTMRSRCTQVGREGRKMFVACWPAIQRGGTPRISKTAIA